MSHSASISALLYVRAQQTKTQLPEHSEWILSEVFCGVWRVCALACAHCGFVCAFICLIFGVEKKPQSSVLQQPTGCSRNRWHSYAVHSSLTTTNTTFKQPPPKTHTDMILTTTTFSLTHTHYRSPPSFLSLSLAHVGANQNKIVNNGRIWKAADLLLPSCY